MHWMLTLAIDMLSKCSARCQSLMYICMVKDEIGLKNNKYNN